MNDYGRNTAGQPEPLDSDTEPTRAGNRKSSGSNSSEWLVNVSDDVVVSMLTSEVVAALRSGRLNDTSLVWRIGMHDWSPLAEVPQLRLAAGPSALLPKAEDAEALAVYARPAASLTFTESARADWQGTGHSASSSSNSPSPVPPGTLRRLTPVAPVPARLTGSAPSSLPPNTLSPTTSEAQFAASGRGHSGPGDRSVIFASELREVKKTSKRLIAWATVSSAGFASLFTFWLARWSPAGAGSAPLAPSVAARNAEPATLAPQPLLPPPQSATPPVSARPAAKVAPAVRHLRRVKRVPLIAVTPRLVPEPIALPTEHSASEAKPASATSAAPSPNSEAPNAAASAGPATTTTTEEPTALPAPTAAELPTSPVEPSPSAPATTAAAQAVQP